MVITYSMHIGKCPIWYIFWLLHDLAFGLHCLYYFKWAYNFILVCWFIFSMVCWIILAISYLQNPFYYDVRQSVICGFCSRCIHASTSLGSQCWLWFPVQSFFFLYIVYWLCICLGFLPLHNCSNLPQFEVLLPPLYELIVEMEREDIRGGQLLNFLHKRCHCGVPELQACIQRYGLVSPQCYWKTWRWMCEHVISQFFGAILEFYGTKHKLYTKNCYIWLFKLVFWIFLLKCYLLLLCYHNNEK